MVYEFVNGEFVYFYYVIWQLLELTNVFCLSRVKCFLCVIVSCIVIISCYVEFFKHCPFLCGTGIWTQEFMMAKQVFNCLSQTSSQICTDYFGDWVCRTICLAWFQTSILMISACYEARIAGLNHWHPPHTWSFILWATVSLCLHLFLPLSLYAV
jgi:hypothetical protein